MQAGLRANGLNSDAGTDTGSGFDTRGSDDLSAWTNPLNSSPTFEKRTARHGRAWKATWRGVGFLSGQFADKLGLPKHGKAIGLLHDLGKYSIDFQHYILSATGLLNQDGEDEEYVDAKGLKGKIDHSTSGAQLVWSALSAQGQKGHFAGQVLALCIASHHSGLIDCLSSRTKPLSSTILRGG